MRRRVAAVYAVVLVLVGIATWFGAWIVLPAAVASLPWFVLAARWWDRLLAVAFVPAASMAAVLLALIAAPVIGIDPLIALIAVFVVAGLGGAAAWWSRTVPLRVAIPRRIVFQGLAASVGAIIWSGALLLTRVLPGASSFAWALLNDAANSLAFTRQIFIDGGVRLGPEENPVPLVAALVAAWALPGRHSTEAADIARHDVLAFAGTWSALIPFMCVLTGMLALRLMRRRTGIVPVAGAALASLLPLTWFIGGLPMEQGYLNIPLGLTIVTIAALGYFGSRAHPAGGLALVAICGTLMLATWSPLVLIVLAYGVVILIRDWRTLIALRGARLALVIVAVAQAAVYAVFATLPTFAVSQEAVLAPIPVYPLRVRVFIVAAAIGILLGIGLWFTRRHGDALYGVLAVVLGGGAAVALFLFLRRGEEEIWGYYPYKAMWLVVAALVIVVFCLAIALVSDIARRWPWALAGFVVLAVATHFLLGAANSIRDYGSMNPLARVLTGTVFVDNEADAMMERVFAFSDPANPGLLWRSGDLNERRIDFWVVKLASPGFDDLEMHQLAYGLDFQDVDQLCRLTEILGPGVTIQTADPELSGQVEDECGELGNEVVLIDG